MPFEIVRNDIANMCVDVIVNTANPHPVIGSGVDSRIHKKAGEKLLAIRKEIGELAYGDTVITPAYNLSANYVIHAVSPVWYDGTHDERALLEQCYTGALSLALEYQCESIAFPLLSAGNQGFPKDVALEIAIGVFSRFLMQYDMKIYLVVFDRNAVQLSEKLFHSVKSYIDETYVAETLSEEYGDTGTRNIRQRTNAAIGRHYLLSKVSASHKLSSETELDDLYDVHENISVYEEAPSAAPRSLEDLLDELEETFSEHLIRLIDQKGMKDPDVYKKANVDRKLFSKIKNDKDYRPKKTTALAFAFALELSLDETLDLIGRAGYTLSHSSKFDVIIEYFLQEAIYDLYTINETLFTFEQPTLIG